MGWLRQCQIPRAAANGPANGRTLGAGPWKETRANVLRFQGAISGAGVGLLFTEHLVPHQLPWSSFPHQRRCVCVCTHPGSEGRGLTFLGLQHPCLPWASALWSGRL